MLKMTFTFEYVFVLVYSRGFEDVRKSLRPLTHWGRENSHVAYLLSVQYLFAASMAWVSVMVGCPR